MWLRRNIGGNSRPQQDRTTTVHKNLGIKACAFDVARARRARHKVGEKQAHAKDMDLPSWDGELLGAHAAHKAWGPRFAVPKR